MTKKISDTKPVLDFIDIATKYCNLIEKRNEIDRVKLLQEAFAILPQLCLCGMKLPEIERWSKHELSKISQEQWREIYESLRHKLGGWDCFEMIFDPFHRLIKNPLLDSFGKPISATLSDAFSDIYRNIKPGLQDWENTPSSERLDILWHWKFLFENQWGHHAASALKALYSLLYSHIVDEYGDCVGMREVADSNVREES